MKTASLTLIVIGVLVGCSGSSEEPPVTFIRAVSQKLSLDKELLFQLHYSSTLTPTFVAEPLLKEGDSDLGSWQLSCEVKPGNGGEARVWLSKGKEPKVNLTPERVKCGKALEVVIKRLVWDD